jgi:hypothetical protein
MRVDKYVSDVHIIFMEFIESPLFTRLVSTYFSEEEYAALQWELVLHPETGDLIKGSGGLRKIRGVQKLKGKVKEGELESFTIIKTNKVEYGF